MPIPLLLNPRAGSLFRSGLKDWLAEHEKEFRFIETQSAEHLTQSARELAEAGEPIVAAAGGDGTLMCAAQGLIGTKAALGILPCGTMNVFARELGIGSRRFDIALEAMKSGKTDEVDIFTVNDKPFLQMASFGMDARVIELITPRLKKYMGAASHIITGCQVAMERHPLIHIELPDGEELRANELIFGNGKRYGGEAILFSEADYRDGKLDMVAMERESASVLFEILGAMLQRGANEDNTDFTELRQITSCTVYSDEKALSYQLDGDYAGTLQIGEKALIKRLPERLIVCVHPNPPALTPLGRFMKHPLVESVRERMERLREI